MSVARSPLNVALVTPPPYQKTFAANFSASDLTAQSGKPNHLAQLVDFTNEGSTAEDAVWTAADGSTSTKRIPPGATYPAFAVSALSASSGTNVSAIAYWWPANAMTGFAINA
jgi:hypothetical protein